MNKAIMQYYELNLRLYSDFTNFFINFFSVPGSYLWSHSACSCYDFLVFSSHQQNLTLSLSFLTLTFWRVLELASYVIEYPQFRFVWLDWGCTFLGRIPYVIHPLSASDQGTYVLWLVILTLITWLRCCLPSFYSGMLSFPFVNVLGKICDYENSLFLLKLLSANMSIHQWILPMKIIVLI